MGKVKKKGIFFTFIAITIMTVFILVFTPQADISLQKDTQAVMYRISNVDNYVGDLENRYFETVLRATAYKTMLSLVFYMNSTGKYVKDLDAAFYEVMLNGTIGNAPIDSITGKKIMDNNTLTNWTIRVINASKDALNVETTIVIKNVSIFQTKPWNIESMLIINFTVKSNVAEWVRDNVTIFTTLSVDGMYDPYYLANTHGSYTNKIKKSAVEFNQWNISRAREHLRNGTYVHWENSGAPSFLMRLINDTTNSSCCGIESFINPNNLDIGDQNESYVDYQFWNHTYTTKCSLIFNITKPPTSVGLWDEFKYFKLDFEHLTKYNITDNDAVRTC